MHVQLKINEQHFDTEVHITLYHLGVYEDICLLSQLGLHHHWASQDFPASSLISRPTHETLFAQCFSSF